MYCKCRMCDEPTEINRFVQIWSRPAAEELRRLLREIQELTEAKMTSEDQIAEEIAEYRAGR